MFKMIMFDDMRSLLQRPENIRMVQKTPSRNEISNLLSIRDGAVAVDKEEESASDV
jgi:hypothetical protein